MMLFLTLQVRLIPFPIMSIQAKAIKKDLGGQWATPSKRAKAPSAAAASRHDISLDNLVDNKRRSARTSSVSTPSSAVTTPKDGAKGRVHHIPRNGDQ